MYISLEIKNLSVICLGRLRSRGPFHYGLFAPPSGYQEKATMAAAVEAGKDPGNGDHPEREQVQGFIAVVLAVRGLVPHHSMDRINPYVSYQVNNGHF